MKYLKKFNESEYDKSLHYQNFSDDSLRREFEDKTGEDSEYWTREEMINKLVSIDDPKVDDSDMYQNGLKN